NSGSQQGPGAAQSGSTGNTQIASSVSGTVSLKSPDEHKLTDQAVLTIKLEDVSSNGGTPLKQKKVSPIQSLPVQFKFDLQPNAIHASDLYVIDAEIIDGERHYKMPLQAPVLTQKAPDHVEIKLAAVPTEGEKVYAE